MSLGLVGFKEGMTQVFKENGQVIPVTVIRIAQNYISQIKAEEKEGYTAIQVTAGEAKKSRVNKALTGHFAKANIPVGKVITEFRILPRDVASGFDIQQYKIGDALGLELFKEGQCIDVAATSKGHGFSGVIVRWGHHSQPSSHGNSLTKRAPGSIGQNQSPGRVFKGKKMPGQYGNERVTMQNLEVVAIDAENQLLLVKGAVPGSSGRYVKILPTVKKARQAEDKN